MTATHRQAFSTEARVVLTVEIDAKVCKSAKAKLRARRKSVNTLTSRLNKATTRKAKKNLRSKIATAKTKRANAAKRVREVC